MARVSFEDLFNKPGALGKAIQQALKESNAKIAKQERKRQENKKKVKP